ncbi:MAG: ABC transporter permease [Bacteroidaceae bacterium]|nr:ABC transporter permease [Bacteroidaceae bacterium]
MNNQEQTTRQLLPSLTGGGRGWVFLTRMKGYTILSLLGLIISLSGTVIISRYLYQEWTVDHFMPNLNRTFVLFSQYKDSPADDLNLGMSYDPNHEADFISPVEGQSEIEAYCDIELRKGFPIAQEGKEVIYPAAITVEDSTFFQIYPVEVVEGARQLTADGQCMVSQELARRLFPAESAVGKSIPIEDGTPHTIQAVYRQPSTKSTLRFDILQFRKEPVLSNSYSVCLVLLHEGADANTYNERQPYQEMSLYSKRPIKFILKPYSELSNRPWWGYDMDGTKCAQAKSSSSHLWMLFFVAMLLLFVGLFNFVNLFAVMRSHRRHELHVRRLFGASRWDLFRLLYSETFVLAVLAMVGVWTVVELTTPLLATYYNIEVMGQWKFDVGLTAVIVIILPLVGPSPGGGSVGGAAAFLFLQFFISLTLLNVSLYFMRQLNAMMTTDPGFRTKGLLSVLLQPHENRESWSEEEWQAHVARSASNRDVILQRLSACPYIKTYCYNPHLIGECPDNEVNGKYKVNLRWINPKAMELYGLQGVAGRTFSDSTDHFAQYLCMVNETFIRQLEVKDFHDFKVQFPNRVWWSSGLDMSGNPPFEIVGVLRDFHPGRQSEPLMPTVYLFENSDSGKDSPFGFEGQYLLMDIAEGHEEDVITYLRDLVHELFGTNELTYQWVEDQRKDLYREDQRTARIFITFSLLAIAVTCLGVLGLMMFDVRRRYREIALRKVHGATFLDIALLLSRRYLIVFAVAAVASLPVSLLVIHRLMASYTIHTSFAWWIPLLSIALILGLCALTLWQQVWKATRIKPYQILKEQ